jgi:hypothetical protein
VEVAPSGRRQRRSRWWRCGGGTIGEDTGACGGDGVGASVTLVRADGEGTRWPEEGHW